MNRIAFQRSISRLLIVFFFLLSTVKIQATNYTYITNVGWASTFGWAGQLKPPSPVPPGDTVFISTGCVINEPVQLNGVLIVNGTSEIFISSSFAVGTTGEMNVFKMSLFAPSFTVNGKYSASSETFCNSSANSLIFNSFTELNSKIQTAGPLIIGAGGHLKMSPGTTSGIVSNNGGAGIVVNGKLTVNNTQLSCNAMTISNTGTTEVINGGVVRCYTTLNNNGVVDAGAGSLFYKHTISTIINAANGLIKGDGTFEYSETYSGVTGSAISAGSNTTGKLNIIYSPVPSYPFNWGNTTYKCDISGSAQGITYDWLAFSNPVNISSALLEVNWGGFIPSPGQSFTILTATSITGQFAAVTIPPVAGRAFTVTYNPASVVVNVLAVLPLQLLNFNAFRNESNSFIQWQTASEVNTKEFIIESSSNGTGFSALAAVNAKSGTSNTYQYEHKNAGTSKLYYRLKMTDQNGQFTYSHVIQITAKLDAAHVMVFPNPVINTITLQSTAIIKNAGFQLTDASGKLLADFRMNNFTRKDIDVSHFPAGIYTLKLHSNGEIITTARIIKQ